jgi:hypothetical protein
LKNPDLAAGAVPSLAGQHAPWADFSFHGRNSATGIHALMSENLGKPRRPRPVQIACHEWRRMKAVVIAGWMNKLSVNSWGRLQIRVTTLTNPSPQHQSGAPLPDLAWKI